jgi:hypothetical protein
MSIDNKTKQLLKALDKLCDEWDERAADDDEKTMTIDEAIKSVGAIIDDFRFYNEDEA